MASCRRRSARWGDGSTAWFASAFAVDTVVVEAAFVTAVATSLCSLFLSNAVPARAGAAAAVALYGAALAAGADGAYTAEVAHIGCGELQRDEKNWIAFTDGDDAVADGGDSGEGGTQRAGRSAARRATAPDTRAAAQRGPAVHAAT
mgnify:CR=1 FL=1